MNNIRIFYIGSDDWEARFQMPENANWICYDSVEKEEKEGLADLVILDRKVEPEEGKRFVGMTRGYCLFATEHVPMDDESTQAYFTHRMGQFLYSEDVQAFLDQQLQNFYTNPYGESFNPRAFVVNPSYRGKITYRGNYDISLEGDFGEDFKQIAWWRNNIIIFDDQAIDFYLEYEKTGDVEIYLKIVKFVQGSLSDINDVKIYTEDQLQDVFTYDNKTGQGFAHVAIFAKGKGTLSIRSLHDRHSRRGWGYFLPGGKRLISKSGEEIFAYFEKGDLKPPFCVYFSGYRTQEGFEGYYMMRSFGCPFLLLTDPRSEGGSFYIGDEEFEEMLTSYIKECLDILGLTPKDMIFSGASMGTYGSLYYGSKLKPYALLLAKPLTNIGVIAQNERILRTGGFATSLDLVMKNFGSLSEEKLRQADTKIWQSFDEADWSDSKFIVSYLYEDDYDPDGYKNILTHLKSKGAAVYGKGSHGRHTDNSSSVMGWFKSQYNKLLIEDFHRGKKDAK